MVEIKFTSPLWKPAPNDGFDTAPDFSPPPILAGEAFACHVLIRDREAQFLKTPCRVRVQCDGCTDGVSLYRIGTVPVRTPVSYTHLDVYKRQGYVRTSRTY